MVMIEMSSGPTDQPTDIVETTDAGTGTRSKSSPIEAKEQLPNNSSDDLADLDLPEDLSCDSIFGEPEPMSATRPVTYVTQSRFFTPLFNAAIFDGPIRIYFAQHQESQAMKLYFNLQGRYADLRKQARDLFRERGSNIFVMLYPDAATFEKSFSRDFDDDTHDMENLGRAGVGAEAGMKTSANSVGEGCSQMIASDRMGRDYVLGVRGPIEDDTFEGLCSRMETIIRQD